MTWSDFLGPNAGYALDLYERYLRDPSSVDAQTRAFFSTNAPPPEVAAILAGQGTEPAPAAPAAPSAAPPTTRPAEREQREQLAPTVPTAPAPVATAPHPGVPDEGTIQHVVAVARLARGIREYGHLDARIDPLGSPPLGDPMLEAATHDLRDADLEALPGSIVFPRAGAAAGTAREAIARLRGIYSGSLGYDFDHVQDFTERAWLRMAVESGTYAAPLTAEERRGLLARLTAVEEFEHFLHSTFQGQKRFSIEGVDMLVPMLDEVIHDAAGAGAREVLIGMAHRGRLNVLVHVLNKPYLRIFAEFRHAPNKELTPSEGSMGINYGWTGDVKYHLGARRVVREGDLVQVQLTMAHNPSHLEFVNPVIEGFTRAAQDTRQSPGAPAQDTAHAIAVLIHGDAAFPGEGVVAETLNLSKLPGYTTGGTIHLIANNQLGFTTPAQQGRSTLYASDLAKGFEMPIIHVNADDPEACLVAVRMAHAYRERFGRDFLVDLVGYRRWGHNEGDEPSFTQPRMYAEITKHPTVRALYAETLAREGVVTPDEAEALRTRARDRLRAVYAEMDGEVADEQGALHLSPSLAMMATGVPQGELRAINEALLARPAGFAAVSKLERLLARRRDALEKGAIDWGHAESLAFGTILADGTPIRLTGQDTERGTFSQRHLVLHDAQTGAPYVPLQALPQARASFAVYNSPLSETAPLGFEYGYSVHAPETLVLWEAQFGDFANAGQVIIDQFIVAARAKWRDLPSLVLLLPHGYEGQGPEHSSARLERYLQLAAEDNLRVTNCTTAAQYFHLLRAQAATLGTAPRPLIELAPKSLLRHPRAAARLDDLTQGHFQPVLQLPDELGDEDEVERLILCSGKIAVELAAAREQAAKDAHGAVDGTLAVARLEQLYPFPEREVASTIARYRRLREVVWLQEEPRNMGAWSFIAPHLRAALPDEVALRYAGRPERASTAEGSAEVHATEQARILAEALADGRLGGERAGRVASETRGGQHG